SALQAIHEDASFNAAADQARRGMKVSRFDARCNVDGSIRAALTNDGAGSSEGNTYPTAPSRNPNIFTGGMRPLRLLDVLPSRPTSSDSFEYVQLNATGDAAEQEQEGDEKAEIDFDG